MKTWRTVAALAVTAGAAVGVGAWTAQGQQQGTPSQGPSQKQEDRTRSPSRQEQPAPRQDERERRDDRDRDTRDREAQDRDNRNRDSRDRRPAALDQDDNNGASRVGRRAFALDDPGREEQFNRTVGRLASQERELLQRNQALLRRLGDARAMPAEQRTEALATVIQESLLEQERLLRYLAEAREAWGGTGMGSEAGEDNTLRQDELQNDRDGRRTPLEREPSDRGRDGQQPGRSDAPRPTNPR